MNGDSTAKIIQLTTCEKTAEELRLEKSVRNLSDTLVKISRAGKRIGENDLACLLICELQSLMLACYHAGASK